YRDRYKEHGGTSGDALCAAPKRANRCGAGRLYSRPLAGLARRAEPRAGRGCAAGLVERGRTTMARVVLTDRKVRALPPAKRGERYDVLDALMPGLLVRVTDRGTKTWHFRARFPGRINPRTGRADPTRRELGPAFAMTVAEARAKAKAWHELIARGIDPKWQA